MMTIDLLKEHSGLGFVASSPRGIALKEQEINKVKIENIPSIINLSGNCTIRYG